MMTRSLFPVLVLISLMACSSPDWRTASRESSGLSAPPSEMKEAVVEVYAADAFSWRGWFAVHTWIAVKEQNAAEYTVFEVVGWRVNRGLPALKTYRTKTPDRYWYGARPEKLLYLSGDKAEALIPELHEAVAAYPWANEYSVFPGPNSNTFPAWIARKIPDLGLRLPLSAIGSGYADRDSDILESD